MVKFFHQSHTYEDSWPTVTLAFFLRYPNPFSTHIASVDVLSRTLTPSHTLLTTRLILKRGVLPRWAPRGILGSRAESWVIEESEVDTLGRVVKCRTRNLDHVKVMRVVEKTTLKEREGEQGGTVHITEALILSDFSRLFRERIEKFGYNRFKANVDRSRQGLSVVLTALRYHRMQFLDGAVGGAGPWDTFNWEPSQSQSSSASSSSDDDGGGGSVEPECVASFWGKFT